MSYVVTCPEIVSLPVRGHAPRFPVHRIYCVGRNYAAHAVEMGHDPDREPPFFFQKNPDNLVECTAPTGGVFQYPAQSTNVHYEVELVVALGESLMSGGTGIQVGHALDHVYGYGVGLDMTRRDLQGEAKKMGRPWEVGKAFEASAPCSEIVPASESGHLTEAPIWLEVNGERRQSGNLSQLIWKVPEMISYLSSLFRLRPGDLVFSGTPAGVGAIVRGDRLYGAVEGVSEIRVEVK